MKQILFQFWLRPPVCGDIRRFSHVYWVPQLIWLIKWQLVRTEVWHFHPNVYFLPKLLALNHTFFHLNYKTIIIKYHDHYLGTKKTAAHGPVFNLLVMRTIRNRISLVNVIEYNHEMADCNSDKIQHFHNTSLVLNPSSYILL